MNACTHVLAEWWADRYRTKRTPWDMWVTWQDPYRSEILDALSDIRELESVYEIGCGAGANLQAIRHRFPHLHFGGSDGSPELCAFAQEQLGVAVDYAMLPDQLPDAAWPVVLSCYALAFLDPDDVRRTLQEIPAQVMVIAEPLVQHESVLLCLPSGGTLSERAVPTWVHPYPAMLAQTGWGTVWGRAIQAPGLLNAVIIAER